jgi:apolipoprotein N-acyltransferase
VSESYGRTTGGSEALGTVEAESPPATPETSAKPPNFSGGLPGASKDKDGQVGFQRGPAQTSGKDQPRTRRRGSVVLPSLAAGVLLGLSLPPWGFWILAILGAGLLYWRVGSLRGRARFLAGFAAGIGLFAPGLGWAVQFNLIGGILLVPAESCFLGLAMLLVTRDKLRLLSFPAALVIATWARERWPFGGLPLGSIALGQAESPLKFSVRLGGALVLVALVALAGEGLAELAIWLDKSNIRTWMPPMGTWFQSPRARHQQANDKESVNNGPSHRQGRLLGGAISLGLALLVALGGWLSPAGGSPIGWLRVAAVQGGGRRGLEAIDVPAYQVFDAAVRATRPLFLLPVGKRPQLVLWPEDVIGLTRQLAGSRQEATMSSLAKKLQSTVVAGVTEPVGATGFRNVAVLWGPSGKIIGQYEEIHRVPFGEYVPFRSLIAHFVNLDDIPRNEVPGHKIGVIRTELGRIGILICYETFFPRRGLAIANKGAQIVLVPANTSSYTTGQVPGQEVAASQLQALSLGRTVIQADPTGYSTVINRNGDLLGRTSIGTPGIVEARVPLFKGSTLYDETGDLPLLVLAALALVLGWAFELRSRRQGARDQLAKGYT